MLLVFHLDGQRYALHLQAAMRVLPMMEVAPLPNAPGVVAGVINVAGRIVPVMDVRRRFGLPARESRLSDVLILAHARVGAVALPADGVAGLLERSEADVTPLAAIAPGRQHVDGVVKLDDGLALIHDVDTFLRAAEQEQLARALRAEEEAR
jgi:purine-binding chemotaxis protein CheW